MPGVRPAGHPMIICTRIRETDQIFTHVENKSADMESAMTFKRGISGNPHGNRHRTRHLLNQEFMQALLLHFRQHGKKAIEKVAREQPGVYLKILALLVPREMQIEHTNRIKADDGRGDRAGHRGHPDHARGASR
jgi:Zn-dependent oligopeptidase